MTDADLFALLVSRTGFGSGPYMTEELYDRTTDWVLLNCYFAPHTKDGELIPLRKRQHESGDPELAPQELPSQEELEVPTEALLRGVPMATVLMFWDVWRQRGLTTEETAVKFEEWLKVYKPRQFRGRTT